MKLDLSLRGLTKIPENLDPNITELYLSNNQISKIENLDKLTNLRVLYLGFNKISKIENNYKQ